MNICKKNGLFWILLVMPVVFFLLVSNLLTIHADTEKPEDIRYLKAVYPSVTTGQLAAVNVPYSDSWFLRSSMEYNHLLAQASMGLAVSSFRYYSTDDTPQDTNVRDFMTQAGFRDIRSYDYDRPSGRYTIACSIGHKEIISEDGNSYELVSVGIAGQGYRDEWLSNFSIGDETVHTGFADAADDIYDRFFGYIAANNLDEKNIRVWVSGFSRSAAVANIFSAQLIDTEWFDPADIFAYTFATPATTKDPKKGEYPSIFNIVGRMDPVPMVPFHVWGYDRYGTTYSTPCQETDSDWSQKKEKANVVFRQLTGIEFWNNPGMDSTLHQCMEYLMQIVPSSTIYYLYLQDKVIDLWKDKSPINILRKLFDLSEDPNLINDSNRDMANELLDFICFNGLFAVSGDSEFSDWEAQATAGANIMHEHTPDVYMAWLMSDDDPEKIYSNNPDYSIVSVNGQGDVTVFDDSGASFTVFEQYDRPAEETDLKLYYDRSGYQKTITIPNDRSYSIRIHATEDQTFTVVRNVSAAENFTVMKSDACRIELKQDEETVLKLEADGTLSGEKKETAENAKEIEAAASPDELEGDDMVTVQDFNVFHVSWKVMVLGLITFNVVTVGFVIFLMMALYKKLRLTLKIRRKEAPQNAKIHAFILLGLITVYELYLLMELFCAIYPNDAAMHLQFKVPIMAILVMIAYYSYLRVPTELHMRTFMALTFLTAGDVMINVNEYAGIALEWTGLLILIYAFWKFNRPSTAQFVGFLMASAIGLLMISGIKGDYGVLRYIAMGYYVTLVFLLFVSLKTPSLFMKGSVCLLITGIMMIFLGVFLSDVLTDLVLHLIMIGIFYTGLVLMEKGMLKVIDLPYQALKPEPAEETAREPAGEPAT
ncbi:MAG: hypothetical protein IKE28_06850 [Solobacterium sp.]|nr:hypothetical protein [Solobacterium sp.]